MSDESRRFEVGDIVWVCADTVEATTYEDPSRLPEPQEPRRIKVVSRHLMYGYRLHGYGYFDSDVLDKDQNNEYMVPEDQAFKTLWEARAFYARAIARYIFELQKQISVWENELQRVKQEIENDKVET